MSQEEVEKDIRESFSLYDRDGNGSISLLELREVLRNLGEKVTDDEINHEDEGFISDLLKRLGVTEHAESIIRLGRKTENKSRVLKITMKSKTSKEEVMSNLRKLKGTEEVFGKISVTDDYTSSERELIKQFTDKAREQGRQDPSRVFKVRGDPKNGLRIISYKKTP